jgi:hypothetical protein
MMNHYNWSCSAVLLASVLTACQPTKTPCPPAAQPETAAQPAATETAAQPAAAAKPVTQPAEAAQSAAAAQPAATETSAQPTIHADIPGCVRMSFDDNVPAAQRQMIVSAYTRVCAAVLGTPCEPLAKELAKVNGRTGYKLKNRDPERMKWPQIHERLKRYLQNSPLISVYIGRGRGWASAEWDGPRHSWLRFPKWYFRETEVGKNIFHTAIHELLHMIPCEENDICPKDEEIRFFDTGPGTRRIPEEEFAPYQVGNAFEEALVLPTCK